MTNPERIVIDNRPKNVKCMRMDGRQELKHRWSVANNYLSGITFGRWMQLLWENRFAIDPVYWHRGAFLTGMSLGNSLAACIEQMLYALLEKPGLDAANSNVRDPALLLRSRRRACRLACDAHR